MKKAFREYHVFTDEEMKKAWKKALVVVDTNVILDFYCFGEKTLEDYYGVLEAIKAKGNLWMPYQVGYEFYENRVGIISKQLKQYENITSYIDTAKEKILALADSSTGHAHLDFKEIAGQYEDKVRPLKARVQRLRNKHPDHLEKDGVVARLEAIYTDNIVGAEFNEIEIEELIKEGEERYSKSIPPGYKDQKKEDEAYRIIPRKYGDLAVWKQIINKAKETKKPVIFVTNDAKDDWVSYGQEKRNLGAKAALRKELLREAGVDFFLYSSDVFLDNAHKQFNLTVEASSVDEVKKYRELESARARSKLVFGEGVDSVHAYIHEPMRLTERCYHRFIESGSPQRAIDTIKEVMDMYRRIHSTFRHGSSRSYEVTASDFSRIDMLLRRCVNIMRQTDEDAIPMIEDLFYMNQKLAELLRSTSEEYPRVLF